MKYLFIFMNEHLSTDVNIQEHPDNDTAREQAEYQQCIAVPLDMVEKVINQ